MRVGVADGHRPMVLNNTLVTHNVMKKIPQSGVTDLFSFKGRGVSVKHS